MSALTPSQTGEPDINFIWHRRGMSYMSFVAGGELSGGIKYAVAEMSGRENAR